MEHQKSLKFVFFIGAIIVAISILCIILLITIYRNKLYKIKKITGKAIIQYYAISPAEYQYLRAANAYADHDSSNLLETPVIFPNNIKGGIGIFAIENPTETSIPLKSIEDY